MDISLDFRPGEGDVSLSERAKKERRGGGWDKRDLLSSDLTEGDRLSISIGFNNEEAEEQDRLFSLLLSAYHIENKASGRVFHSAITARLSKEEATTIRDYLTFLLGI